MKVLKSNLVSNKLAACVNIIPGLISVYEWEGKINNDEEVLVLHFHLSHFSQSLQIARTF